ncbi:MAG: aminoacyl-tRNA hydrolase [Flavobacteriaceae bacterium]|nr:aminoacyl-tRNA hydrolase [Flavobacteriaceae bacterium]
MVFWRGFFPKKAKLNEADSMKKYLVVGLGNVGVEYKNTRHNIGFKILDAYAEAEKLSFETAKLGSICTHKIKGRMVLFLKPNTYMNRSGKAVKYWLDREKIPLENLLVITDDLNLPFGSIRLKGKGSDGGHNGLKDIQQLYGNKYPRFRFGIGDSFSKGRQVDYVLGKWSPEEERLLPERCILAAALIESFVFAGLQNTMNSFNGK